MIRHKLFRLVTWLCLTASTQAIAGGLSCPPMPSAATELARDVKVDINTKIGSLGKAKLGELSLRTDIAAKNLLSNHPQVDRLIVIQTLSATYCTMLIQTVTIPEADRLRRWEAFQERIVTIFDHRGLTNKSQSTLSDPRSSQQKQAPNNNRALPLAPPTPLIQGNNNTIIQGSNNSITQLQQPESLRLGADVSHRRLEISGTRATQSVKFFELLSTPPSIRLKRVNDFIAQRAHSLLLRFSEVYQDSLH